MVKNHKNRLTQIENHKIIFGSAAFDVKVLFCSREGRGGGAVDVLARNFLYSGCFFQLTTQYIIMIAVCGCPFFRSDLYTMDNMNMRTTFIIWGSA